MGYCKIIQFGDTTEIYEYENTIKSRPPDRAKAERLANPQSNNAPLKSFDLAKKRSKSLRLQSKAKGIYKRSDASIKRSKNNFFRLCHHNNCLATTIHFVTLTFQHDIPYKTANRYVKEFFRRIQTHKSEISISYISVSELTKKGRFHFHLLVYNLPPETAVSERETRNFQRLFRRGFVDISLASYTSTGIAGYMAKYMAKSITSLSNETTRGYTSSRNIGKFTSAGSNQLSEYSSLIIPSEDIEEIHKTTYNVPYLGTCRYTKIIKKLDK
jgi:hypothetical protein